MVVQAYTVCIRVTLECRRMESEMIGDGRGGVDKADKVRGVQTRHTMTKTNQRFENTSHDLSYYKW